MIGIDLWSHCAKTFARISTGNETFIVHTFEADATQCVFSIQTEIFIGYEIRYVYKKGYLCKLFGNYSAGTEINRSLWHGTNQTLRFVSLSKGNEVGCTKLFHTSIYKSWRFEHICALQKRHNNKKTTPQNTVGLPISQFWSTAQLTARKVFRLWRWELWSLTGSDCKELPTRPVNPFCSCSPRPHNRDR